MLIEVQLIFSNAPNNEIFTTLYMNFTIRYMKFSNAPNNEIFTTLYMNFTILYMNRKKGGLPPRENANDRCTL